MAGSRPEYAGPPEQYYNEVEARKYSTNTRIRKVQHELAQRAYELLELPDTEGPSMLLDIGCGSGLSGEVLDEHCWVGVDISSAMLKVAKEDNESEGELVLADMGAGLPFRPACFDGAISISAIQWLCHSNSKAEDPRRRLLHFFESLHACLCRSARAVFQFYPESPAQSELISQQALRAGFQGGLVVDRPDSAKHRKVFLVLSAGKTGAIGEAALTHRIGKAAEGMKEDEGEDRIQNVGRSRHGKGKNQKLARGKQKGGLMKKMSGKIEKRRQRREGRKQKKREQRTEQMEEE